MKKNFLKILWAFLFVIFLSGCNSIDLEMNGKSSIELELGEPYVEEGITVNKDLDYIVVGEVDHTEPGNYELEYYVIDDDGAKSESIFRTVRVVDTTPPEYTLKEDIVVTKGNFVIEELFVSVDDNSNSDIEYNSNFDSVINETESGTYTITISLKDQSDNMVEFDVDIEYMASDWDILLDYAKTNGEQKESDDSDIYFSISYEETWGKYTLSVYENESLLLSQIYNYDNGSADITNISADFGDVIGLNFIMFTDLDSSGDITGMGYDDNAMISATNSIVYFDDSTFTYNESHYEDMAEISIEMTITFFNGVFAGDIGVPLD